MHFPPSHVGEQLRVTGDGSHQTVVSVVRADSTHVTSDHNNTSSIFPYSLSPNIFKYSTIQGKISIRLQQLWRRCGAEFMECSLLHPRLDTVPFLPSLVMMIAVQSWILVGQFAYQEGDKINVSRQSLVTFNHVYQLEYVYCLCYVACHSSGS